MSGRKSVAVQEAVALIVTGHCKSAYEAAKQMGVAASSIHRDAAYKAWQAAQKGSKQ